MSSFPRPRTVLVTGAARRLGRSIALALAAGGWQVAVHYRESAQDAMDTVAACAQLSGASAHFDADFSNETAVRALLPRVIDHFGSVDAVVNSASLFEHDNAQSFGFAALEKHLRSNTGAPIVLARPCTSICKTALPQAKPTHRAPWSTCWTRSSGTRTPIF